MCPRLALKSEFIKLTFFLASALWMSIFFPLRTRVYRNFRLQLWTRDAPLLFIGYARQLSTGHGVSLYL